MKISKNKFVIILGAISVLIFGIVIFNLCRNKSDNYFYVKTTVTKYSSSMSQLKGFPFKIMCNNDQKITITITDGFLFNNINLVESNNNTYVANCNQTVYWNFMDEENNIKDIDTVKLYFKSSDSKLVEEEFALKRDTDGNYLLTSN